MEQVQLLEAFETELDRRFYLVVATVLNSDVQLSTAWDLGVPQINRRVKAYQLNGLGLAAVVFQCEHRAPLSKLMGQLKKEASICFLLLTQSFPIFENATEKKLPEEVWNMRDCLDEWQRDCPPLVQQTGVTLFDGVSFSPHFKLTHVSPIVVEDEMDDFLDDVAKGLEATEAELSFRWSQPPSPIAPRGCTLVPSPIDLVDELLQDVGPLFFSPIQHDRHVALGAHQQSPQQQPPQQQPHQHQQQSPEQQQPRQQPAHQQQPHNNLSLNRVDHMQQFKQQFKGQGAIGVAMHNSSPRDQLKFKKGDTILIYEKSNPFQWIGTVVPCSQWHAQPACFSKTNIQVVWE
ncbi:MAG: hypothetical protein K0U52_13760 [Gammaproteobacteria bacterium]|nr:hypothetical protein [Gammaproteobacteria bacterium]